MNNIIEYNNLGTREDVLENYKNDIVWTEIIIYKSLKSANLKEEAKLIKRKHSFFKVWVWFNKCEINNYIYRRNNENIAINI